MYSSHSKFRGSYDLEYVSMRKNCVFPIVLTCGDSKPKDLEFLDEFNEDLKGILERGVQDGEKVLTVTIRGIVCDAPARALVKGFSTVNEILSTNSRNLPVYSELISLAEKDLYDGELAPEILNTKDHAITSTSTRRTPSQRSDISNVSSQEIPTTGTIRERHSQRNSGVLDAYDLSSHETPSTSFMSITPAGRRSQPNNGFQRSVLTKLETLIDKLEET
ncbi:uncharacterized protein LOC124448785 isoform X1 [Xenia sp. Carnegie-2017]|uniref:uncharacterized protein LOC124448785 isoform X1 n=1 Tax=Xenia sp. Carnegie-2017 TaxID=2897299 RepID=UPI001F04BF71|nr:uncharacterized protein LOC124448785 isoform X1 [Xenia sp. Carnegie-2017]